MLARAKGVNQSLVTPLQKPSKGSERQLQTLEQAACKVAVAAGEEGDPERVISIKLHSLCFKII